MNERNGVKLGTLAGYFTKVHFMVLSGMTDGF